MHHFLPYTYIYTCITFVKLCVMTVWNATNSLVFILDSNVAWVQHMSCQKQIYM